MITINRNPSLRDLRLFCGLWLPLLGRVMGAILRWRVWAPEPALWVWGTTAILSLAGLASPRVGRLLFVGLSMLTFPVGFCMSYLILAILFFGILTPIALVMRAFGRDVLQLHSPVVRPGQTNWVERPSSPDIRQHFHQF